MAGFAYLAVPSGGSAAKPSDEMVFGAGCEELVASSTLLPQLPCAAVGSEARLVQGHGDWSGPLPSLEEIEAKLLTKPWTNQRGWGTLLAQRVLGRQRIDPKL
jgi:hypothetical protein